MLQKIYNVFRMEMNAASFGGYFLQALPIALVVGIVYAVVRTMRLKRRGKQLDWKAELLRWLFVCYLTGLCSLVILPANFWLHVYDGIFYGWWEQLGPIFQLGEVNLTPAIVRYFGGAYALGSWVKRMLIGNIVMLIPFGLFLCLLSNKFRGKRAVASAVIIPFAIELLQHIFGRSFDVDDIICNFLGMMLGFLLGLGIKRANKSGRT